MSYGYLKNVTPIDELPHVDELDDAATIDMMSPIQRRYIKDNYIPPAESGMRPSSNGGSMYATSPPLQPMQQQPQQQPVMSCPDCCQHVMSCPVCSRFFSCDKTIYIIIIAILSIVCILLLKKVLDV